MEFATQLGLVPAPRHCQAEPGPPFTIDAETNVLAAAGFETAAVWLAERLRRATGHAIPVRTLPPASARAGADPSAGPGGERSGTPSIRLVRGRQHPPEGFELCVAESGVELVAGDAAGVLYGAATLLQLLPADVFRRAPVRTGPWRAPAVRVRDWPEHAWRGVMLDVARHFRTVAEVLRFIDLMTLHRFNRLQLHLTDDQGWRVEIERFPRLTEVGAWRSESVVGAGPRARGDGRPHGGYYTAADLREITAYAAARGIEVIPEIEAPGHVQAAIAAYPELGVGGVAPAVSTRWGLLPYALNLEESTIEFFCAVLDEVMAAVDGEHVAIGGDECDTTQWRRDGRTAERMRELGLTDPAQAQSWIVGRLGAHIASRGRRMLAWDDILTGPVPDGAAVLSWRGTRGALAAARAGFDVIMAPEDRAYLDYRQSDSPNEPVPVGTVTSLERSYGMPVVPAELDPSLRTHVLGAQAELWSEHLDTVRALDFAAFPRLCALSEVFWGTQGTFSEFCARLRVHRARLDALGVAYRPPGGPTMWQQRPDAPGRPRDRADRETEVANLTRDITAL